MTNYEARQQGLRPFTASTLVRNRDDRDAAMAQVRALIPAGARDVKEREHTRCYSCGDEYCPFEPAMFTVEWFA